MKTVVGPYSKVIDPQHPQGRERLREDRREGWVNSMVCPGEWVPIQDVGRGVNHQRLEQGRWKVKIGQRPLNIQWIDYRECPESSAVISEVSHEVRGRPLHQVRVGAATRASKVFPLKPDVNLEGQTARSRGEGVDNLWPCDIDSRPQRGEHKCRLSPVVAHVRRPLYPLVKRSSWRYILRFVDGGNLTSEEEEHIGQGLPWNAVDGPRSILRPTELDYHH